jgi:hypothetical protein
MVASPVVDRLISASQKQKVSLCPPHMRARKGDSQSVGRFGFLQVSVIELIPGRSRPVSSSAVAEHLPSTHHPNSIAALMRHASMHREVVSMIVYQLVVSSYRSDQTAFVFA